MAKTPLKPKRTPAEPQQPDDASREAKLIPMGRLGAAHGLAGWLRVVSYADPPEQLQNYRHWTLLVNDRHKEVTLRSLRTTGKGFACRLEDIENPGSGGGPQRGGNPCESRHPAAGREG